MKVLINFFLLTFITYVVKGFEFSEDVYMFLPFVKHYEAPPECPSNELYKICASKCSDCNQRGMCITTTCVEGCDCAPRFFRVTPDGPCEPVANCPRPECVENEVFRECGPICERCTTRRCRSINCDHKCYCKEGFLRNSEHKCIPEEECPKRQHCCHNEEWAESGPADEFCLQGANRTANNKTRNAAQCYCKEGYKRNARGRCVNEQQCSSMKCLGVEVHHSCIPKCNTTCRNYGKPNCTEDDNCYPGCFCPPGYVMNDLRTCIPVENCTLDITQVKIMKPSETEEVASSDPDSTTTSSSDSESTTASSSDSESTTASSSDSESTTASSSDSERTIASSSDSERTIASSSDSERTTASSSDSESTTASSPDSERSTASSPDSERSTAFSPDSERSTASSTNANTDTTEYPCSGETSDDHIKDSEEITETEATKVDSTSDQSKTETSASPTTSSPRNGNDQKGKRNKTGKHVNTASSTTDSKQEIPKDEFDNENI